MSTPRRPDEPNRRPPKPRRAVALYFAVVRRFLGDPWLALLASSLLMVSHSMWCNSTTVESYAFNAFFTVLALWLALRHEQSGRDRFLYALFAIAGLAILWRFNNSETSTLYDWAGFVANPDKRHHDDTARFAALLFAKLPECALIVDDDGRTFGLLRYFQRQLGRRPDVRIEAMNSWGFAEWGVSPERLIELAKSYPARVFVVSDMVPYEEPLAALREAGGLGARDRARDGAHRSRWARLRACERCASTPSDG